MNTLVDLRDVRFIIYEQFGLEELTKSEPFIDQSREDYDMVLDTAEKLAVNVMEPLNQLGDREGCRYENGQVLVPEAYVEGHQQIIDGGWQCVADDPEVGGQGLPQLLNVACKELFVAANSTLISYAGLAHGVAKIIEIYGSEEQKEKYMLPLYEGRFSGTMCLTEPQAGSDVGATRTKAVPLDDGTYSITGNKIFITSGDHNLSENIIHAVLARIEGDRPGTKGLSLFLVPKFSLDEEGNAKEPNDVACTGIEHKMGIHASSTCSLSFGDSGKCVGYLLGKNQQGIEIMFHLMNSARIGVGCQASAFASTSFLKALAYAKERLQGSHISQIKNPDAPSVPIIQHPDVRRMLSTMKAYVEGDRALLYFAAYCVDRISAAITDEEKFLWQGYLDLLTPIIKGYISERSFEVCVQAMQVFGGYGYTVEYPIEQYMRDCKITSIYEGTTGIQALDLLGRKLGMKGGKVFQSFNLLIDETIAKVNADSTLKPYADELDEARKALLETVMKLAGRSRSPEFMVAIGAATPFLELFGDVVLAWLLLWQAVVASEKLDDLKLTSENRDAAFYTGKIGTAKFYIGSLLPRIYGKVKQVLSSESDYLTMPENAFSWEV